MKFLVMLLLAGLPAFADGTYNCTVTTQSDVNITGSTTLALSANSARRCLIIENKLVIGNAASTLEIKFLPSGASTSNVSFTGTQGLKVASGSPWMPVILPINAIYLKSSSGTLPVTIIEGQ